MNVVGVYRAQRLEEEEEEEKKVLHIRFTEKYGRWEKR